MSSVVDQDPLWYKDAVIYELHVRAFNDSNADGVGDFPGLTEKLDYLQELGVTALWILPFYPSPLRDDGYDISDFTDVNPIYGRLGDVRQLVRQAHRRGLRVLNELVCNHTSDQHPWFQRARRARPDSPWRDFYVWSETNQKYLDARIIFKDFETSNWTWDHVAGAYYWHRFYSHQPDLNFDNPRVQQAIFRVTDFWLDVGMDGMRLDAIPYLFEREGTNCENLPETHEFLKSLRRHVDEHYPNRMLLAEANQWPEDAVAYFGNGDECHMAFHFPLMPRLFMAIRMEDRFPIVDILTQTPAIPEPAQWALFLRNHDELTLEMVTDEERDYMYRTYTRDREARINLGIRHRLAPLLGNNRRRIELMNGLLFSLPGTPVIYYGDEIGMGDNIFLGDRNGVRTPMQWNSDRNAGFSRANRQRLYLPVITDPEYHYETVNVEAQRSNPHSLLNWTRRLIALRRNHHAFGRGTLQFLRPTNRKILVFLRCYEEERILCIANLSRFVQAAELDLSSWQGFVPVEMFGQTEFPPIGELPYFITLGPHEFYWFLLQPQAAPVVYGPDEPAAARLPVVHAVGGWEELFEPRGWPALAEMLPRQITARRWFASKTRRITSAHVRDAIRLGEGSRPSMLLLLDILYSEGDPETYVLPLATAAGEDAERLLEQNPSSALAWIQEGAQRYLLYDAMFESGFAGSLLEAIGRRRRVRASAGTLVAAAAESFARLRGQEPLQAAFLHAEQSNNSIVYGQRLMLKLYRRVEEGPNPELELERFLTEEAEFRSIAPLAGSLEYRQNGGTPLTLGILLGFVPNEGDAWRFTLGAVDEYLSRVGALAGREPPPTSGSVLQQATDDLPPLAWEAVGDYLGSAEVLGRRTAEMHLALASRPEEPAFAPEPMTSHQQRSIYQSIHTLATRTLQLLQEQSGRLPEPARADAAQVLESQPRIFGALRDFLGRRLSATRIRVHGDFHLGQLLKTSSDFVIIDFEGEPARSFSERRIKRPALRDVAGMLRSFSYAAEAGLGAAATPELRRWASFWVTCVSAAYLRSYLETAGNASFVPRSRDETEILIRTLLLEKALYELRYELNSRPEMVDIPLRGILALLDADSSPRAAGGG